MILQKEVLTTVGHHPSKQLTIAITSRRALPFFDILAMTNGAWVFR
jgi:hypothetical protein